VLVGKEPLGAFLVVTQFVAELASQWFVQRRLETVEWEADAACALAELTTRLAVQQSNVDACRQLAVDLQRFANSGNVFVGLRKSARHACLLAAVSAAKSFDRHGELTAAIQPVLDVAASADTLQMYSGPFALESTPKGLIVWGYSRMPNPSCCCRCGPRKAFPLVPVFCSIPRAMAEPRA
jgi:hypothetical protein